MRLKAFIKRILGKWFFYPKWRCVVCGKEIFDGAYVCQDCYNQLPFITGAKCGHCGRKVIAFENYCSTCKNVLVSLDLCRSVFSYEKPISGLIKKAKYDNGKYLIEYFAELLAPIYLQNYISADLLTFVPMTDKAKKKRGYNQSELLAEAVAKRINLPVVNCLKKVKETNRQATLGRKDRLKNLEEAFRVFDKKAVKDKSVVIVDDVTTTGATAEVIAKRLKKAGAKQVFLITVASTPPIDKY